jgi:hypothetical protein
MPAEQKIGKGESLQIRTRTVAIVLVGILFLLAGVGFGLTLFFPDRVGVRYVVSRSFPAPAVIPDEHAQRLQLEAGQHRALAGEDGRMPIGQAMAAIVARGSHAFDPVGQ